MVFQALEKSQGCQGMRNKQKTPVNCLKGIKVSSSKKGMWLTAQLKCFYTYVCSMGNKQEELETAAQMENHDQIAITEIWWDELHDQSAMIDGYKLFRRDRQGRRGGGVAVYAKTRIDCMK